MLQLSVVRKGSPSAPAGHLSIAMGDGEVSAKQTEGYSEL